MVGRKLGGLPLDDCDSTVASDSDTGALDAVPEASTVSGASGKFLAEELARWVQSKNEGVQCAARRLRLRTRASDKLLAMNTWERVELKVKNYYDRPFGGFFNFVYDVLQFSSGRDKLCALMQGYMKSMSAMEAVDSERYWTYRGAEDSLSDGRKIFRLFKEFREVYKVRRGFHRMQEGIREDGILSIAAICGSLDMAGHTASFFFYLFDNILWATSVGLLRAKEIPTWQLGMWKGLRRNGRVVSSFGGVTNIKRKKNFASIFRLMFAMTANLLLFRKALDAGVGFQGPDDARLFHTIELVGMFASFRLLQSKLGFAPMFNHVRMGQLAMLSAACGLWSNWRKVVRKQCGTKKFVTSVDRRRTRSVPDLSESAMVA